MHTFLHPRNKVASYPGPSVKIVEKGLVIFINPPVDAELAVLILSRWITFVHLITIQPFDKPATLASNLWSLLGEDFPLGHH